MTRIDHVNIVVGNIERSVEFYQRLLGLRRGFEVTLEGDWIAEVTRIAGSRAHCVFLEPDVSAGPDPATRLELLQYLTPNGASFEANSLPNTAGLRHLAFEVDDIDAVVARLRAAGLEPVSDPVTVPFAVGTRGRKRLCYFHDPDGTLLEVAAYG
jgi:catechol 2,3-dioxygenase-like lactoylglutathione lyase family enzyme